MNQRGTRNESNRLKRRQKPSHSLAIPTRNIIPDVRGEGRGIGVGGKGNLGCNIYWGEERGKLRSLL